MSREIVEAIKGLEQEKGIDAETLMAALEDALLSAYKNCGAALAWIDTLDDVRHQEPSFRVRPRESDSENVSSEGAKTWWSNVECDWREHRP